VFGSHNLFCFVRKGFGIKRTAGFPKRRLNGLRAPKGTRQGRHVSNWGELQVDRTVPVRPLWLACSKMPSEGRPWCDRIAQPLLLRSQRIWDKENCRLPETEVEWTSGSQRDASGIPQSRMRSRGMLPGVNCRQIGLQFTIHYFKFTIQIYPQSSSSIFLRSRLVGRPAPFL